MSDVRLRVGYELRADGWYTVTRLLGDANLAAELDAEAGPYLTEADASAKAREVSVALREVFPVEGAS